MPGEKQDKNLHGLGSFDHRNTKVKGEKVLDIPFLRKNNHK
jgi:hypothetical protein